ncbi:MAG: hypothetical protein LBQ50_04035 [Planctomycetaceae bacterium]|nr:hypothetical protein [Planctomycetaceae bacterium]
MLIKNESNFHASKTTATMLTSRKTDVPPTPIHYFVYFVLKSGKYWVSCRKTVNYGYFSKVRQAEFI